jgi:hypothetical protein
MDTGAFGTAVGLTPDVILVVGEGCCPDCMARLEPVETHGRCPNGHGYWMVGKTQAGDWYFAWHVDDDGTTALPSPTIIAMWPRGSVPAGSAYARVESPHVGVTSWVGYRPAGPPGPS